MTMEVDHAKAGKMARELHDLGIAADFHNDPMADGNRLYHGVLGINRENVSVYQHQVSRCNLRGGNSSQQQNEQSVCPTRCAPQRHASNISIIRLSLVAASGDSNFGRFGSVSPPSRRRASCRNPDSAEAE